MKDPVEEFAKSIRSLCDNNASKADIVNFIKRQEFRSNANRAKRKSEQSNNYYEANDIAKCLLKINFIDHKDRAMDDSMGLTGLKKELWDLIVEASFKDE